MAMTDLHMGVSLPFETPEQRAHSEEILVRFLAIMCKINLQYLLRNPDVEPLYSSGVVYDEPDQLKARKGVTRSRLVRLIALCKEMQLEPEEAMMMLRIAKGVEVFLDTPSLYRRGKGDCNELVPQRIAELWRNNILASPFLEDCGLNSRGGRSYHAVVWYPADDSIEDPSLILGMGGPERANERRIEIDKNTARWANHIAAAKYLSASEGVSQQLLSQQIDSMGFVPKSGVFKSPYPQRALRRAA